MARKSQRLSAASQATPAHKRTISSSAPSSVVDTKRPRKANTPRQSSTKSHYFEHESDDGDDPSESPSATDENSEFGDGAEADSPLPDTEDDEDEEDSEDERPKRPSKSISKKGATTSAAIRSKGQELWRPGVKTGLGPGTQVVIKKPKARAAGKTAYEDETIHPNTLLFLADLKANNDRQWLKNFRQSEKDWHAFVDKITEKLVHIDDTIPELPVKDVIFRIYRDIRFSPDPTPYKSRTGRKGPYAHYYVHLAPYGQSFLGGGLWHPEPAPTAAMRREIDRRPQRIKAVLTQDGLRKEFLKGAPKDDAKVVKTFVASNAENALKTKPKGFDADHAEIELLRLRNYTIGRKLEESDVTSPDFLDRVAHLLTCMKPFITYLNSVVMPDEDDEDDDVDDDEEVGGEGESDGEED